MAYVENIQLTVSAIGGGQFANKAEVKCKIKFTTYEITANSEFIVRASLWEQDEGRDRFHMRADGTVSRVESIGDPDDIVGAIGSKLISPNGNNEVDITLAREWTFNDLDDLLPTAESFFATVSVFPVLAMGDWKFSPVVNVDVG